MENSSKVEHLIKRYGTREELAKHGVWRGELYRAEESSFMDRGWCWKTLLLGDGDEPLVTDLAIVPENSLASSPVHSATRQYGIRNLTSERASTHPLMTIDDAAHTISKDGDDDRLKEKVSVQETLDIIELDVSRLLLDPIFESAECKKEMVEILYNYVLYNQTSYKQGYHELCGAVYMQMFREVPDTRKLNTLNIFNKLMKRARSVFYEEAALLQFAEFKFDRIFRITVPKLHHLLTKHHGLDNAVWLIRWTRLLFLREFDLNYVLRIWDHLLTFMIPLEDLVACCIVVLLIAITRDLYACEDQGEVIGLLLHYPSHRLIDCVELMKQSASLYELYVTKQFSDMEGLGENLCKVHNRQWYDKQTQVVDHNRLRLEERLKRRVGLRLNKN
ncbi:LANO_0H09450g1_1 [Lachancea nothofagi CBS 11611]|uniref:LANO_0H09450g1_1 n=1 Tax=Lachancea nothofagi CBS 11611 TaxID=1266666 RepID=A0A1G4KM09_9SACH|nr:LANO_0H09450g1_1 [Lachancea nothofagi CBS 11611]